ncbi:MAG TPA: hypothetical protein VFP65_11275 [Anaeromyxobacteraceae bacterium]|nr:hypothetical protein [Anaeromyxobacteraceae bacterium]
MRYGSRSRGAEVLSYGTAECLTWRWWTWWGAERMEGVADSEDDALLACDHFFDR